MARWEIHYLSGDISEVFADTLGEAKEQAAEENPGIGVRKAVLIDADDEDDDPLAENPTDQSDEEENPLEDEDDLDDE